MADVKISALPASTTPLAGTEVLPIVQSATTRQVSVANLTAGRAVNALSITASSLTSGRVTYAGTAGLLQDSASLTFDGTTVTATKFAGALNGTVGATTASSGAFTTGTFSGAVTLGAISSFGTSLLHTIGGHSFVQGDANATYLYGGAGTGIQLRNSANSATLVTFADSLTTYTSPVTFNAAITLGAVSSFGTGLLHTIGGHNFIQGDATTTYLYGGTGGISFRNAANTSELAIITDAGNVGIGTSSPGSKLVVGNGNASEYIDVYINGGTSSNYGPVLGFQKGGTSFGQIANYGRIQGGTSSDFFITSVGSNAVVFGINQAEKVRIDTSGIVTMNAYGAGAATFSAAGVISSVSDETWKTKDGVPTNTDAMIQKLEPGYWFYNEEKAPTFGEERQLGFYAQNVHEAIGEEAAPTPQEGKPWGYHDRSVLAITVMSLKNALNTIEELKQRITALENK